MSTVMKSLFQQWLKWESGLDHEDEKMPQCGEAKQQVEGTHDSGIEDAENITKYTNSASPWVHGLL